MRFGFVNDDDDYYYASEIDGNLSGGEGGSRGRPSHQTTCMYNRIENYWLAWQR